MSHKRFSSEEIELLRQNPNVKNVTEKSIQFSEQFKLQAVELYHQGLKPMDIFRDAGFDVSVLGFRRISNAFWNWMVKKNRGKQVTSDHRGRSVEKILSAEELIAKQKLEIKLLQQENDFLRQIRRLERRYQPQKSPSDKSLK